MPPKADLGPVFAGLRSILAEYAPKLRVVQDRPGDYSLDTYTIGPNKKRLDDSIDRRHRREGSGARGRQARRLRRLQLPVYAPALPAKLDVMLAMRFDVEPLDYGVRQNIAVHIMDEDSSEMVNLRASPVSFDAPKTPGLPLAYDLILPLTVGFPREGTWTFDVRVNEKSVARVLLRVEARS
jgi:hypothetical protein